MTAKHNEELSAICGWEDTHSSHSESALHTPCGADIKHTCHKMPQERNSSFLMQMKSVPRVRKLLTVSATKLNTSSPPVAKNPPPGCGGTERYVSLTDRC